MVWNMKGMRLFITLLLVLPPLFFGKSFALTNEEATHILKDYIKTEFKILEIKETPWEGFWEVACGIGQDRMIFYIHKNLRFIISGQILDRQTKRNLTLDRLRDFRRVDPSTLHLENAIPMGEGKRKLYVFTDPQCHFCFQLHEELKQIKDLQAFFFLYPLTPDSYEKAKSIWCSQDRRKALEETYQGKELRSPSCDTTPISKNMELGRRLLIDSTPTLFFQNGKIMEGYVPPDTLENLLKSNSGL
jgi:thiol:disulfide interchange protein DsbC